MATIKYKNVGIRALSACVPSKIESNDKLTNLLSKEDVKKTIQNIGIKEKRYADTNVCASDLCYKAANKLLAELSIERNSIDMLIFMSQTSDYRIPATAPLLQNRLNLSKDCASFDINLGCSGYVYSLSTAFAYASLEGVNRVLLLVGETFSKITSPLDKVNYPLYGDAGTATLIEKGEFTESFFILNSDGAGENAVKIYSGGMRDPSSNENLKMLKDENGDMRTGHQIFMNGVDVFNFTMSVVPKSIKKILKESNNIIDDVDYIIFHQANKFMTDFFAKRLKYPLTKVPYCLDRFGNTSSASIPLTIVDQMSEKIKSNPKVILSGFGAGLSWGTALISFNNCKIIDVLEY